MSKWFGARTIFKLPARADRQGRAYEERIVLLKAESKDDAIARAEVEAKTYAAEGWTYLDYVEVFEMFDEPGDNAEIFSQIRHSKLTPAKYVDRFFDTGHECSRDWEPGPTGSDGSDSH